MEPIGRPLQIDEIQRGLKAERLGKRILYTLEVDSTNIFARRRAEQDAPEGEIVIAEQQTDGRGRFGRRWVSPGNVNLYLSVILRPRLPPAHAPQITLMAAVALAETVASFIPLSPQIKWPNDILVDGKKLAGILAESSCEPGRLVFVILGIGVNLNFPVELMPETIRERATSIISLTRKPVSRELFARRLIQSLDRCYGELDTLGFSAIAPRWETYFSLRGKKVKIDMGDDVLVGRVIGINGEGILLLEDDYGSLQRVIAGDVTPMEEG
jgi:BirA family biotin operon repressor/biotin-[acetyl-CoA-carboxylase] ligase